MNTSRSSRTLSLINRSRGLALIAMAAASVAPRIALAGPKGESVVAGAASFQRSGNLTQITAANNTIIRYSSFDVGGHETVRFIQPSAVSRVLNRIESTFPTRIDGTIQANGRVIMINPSGMVFGPNAVISAAGFIAAAANLSNQDFLAGNDHFTNVQGTVTNYGRIHADHVALVGRQVANHGAILSNKTITLVAGTDVYLAEADDHILVKVAGLQSGEVLDGAGVTNTGTLEARRGQVLLGAGDMYSLATFTSGNVSARHIEINDGEKTVTRVSGKLDASDSSNRGTGGTIKVLGDRIAVEHATLDASGNAGGGTILIGGNWQGKGPEKNAQRVLFDGESSITADATADGNGGKVVLWSDQLTYSSGRITARGGSHGGDGGQIEVSSARAVGFRSGTDVSAVHGASGLLLLDPENITVRKGSGNGDEPADAEILAGDYSGDVFITQDALQAAALSGGAIRLEAANDIIVEPLSDDPSQGGTLDLTNASSVSLIADADQDQAGAFLMNPGYPQTGSATELDRQPDSIVTNGDLTIRGASGTDPNSNKEGGALLGNLAGRRISVVSTKGDILLFSARVGGDSEFRTPASFTNAAGGASGVGAVDTVTASTIPDAIAAIEALPINANASLHYGDGSEPDPSRFDFHNDGTVTVRYDFDGRTNSLPIVIKHDKQDVPAYSLTISTNGNFSVDLQSRFQWVNFAGTTGGGGSVKDSSAQGNIGWGTNEIDSKQLQLSGRLPADNFVFETTGWDKLTLGGSFAPSVAPGGVLSVSQATGTTVVTTNGINADAAELKVTNDDGAITVDALARPGVIQTYTGTAGQPITLAGPVQGKSVTAVTANGSLILHDVTTQGDQLYTGQTISLDKEYKTNGGVARYQGAVSLKSTDGSTGIVTDGGDVVFEGTVNGGKKLIVDAGTGAVSFEGAMGQSEALDSVAIVGQSLKLKGAITNGADGQSYNVLRPGPATGNQLGLIELEGLYDSGGKNIYINNGVFFGPGVPNAGPSRPDDKAAVPTVATLIRRTGDLQFYTGGGDFVMGQNQRIVVVDGNMVIDTRQGKDRSTPIADTATASPGIPGGNAYLSDIVVAGDPALNHGNLAINTGTGKIFAIQRKPQDVLVREAGGQLTTVREPGTTIVAAGAVKIHTSEIDDKSVGFRDDFQIIAAQYGANQVPSGYLLGFTTSTEVAQDVQGTAGGAAILNSASSLARREIPPTPEQPSQPHQPGEPATPDSAAIAAAADPDNPGGADVNPGPGFQAFGGGDASTMTPQQRFFASTGIGGRQTTAEETSAALQAGYIMYNDTGSASANGLAVARARLPQDVLQRTVQTFDELFTRPVIDPQSGSVQRVDRTGQVRQNLSAAIKQWKDAGDSTDLFDYVRQHPDTPGARDVVLLQTLLQQMRQLGLSPYEQDAAINRMLAPITPQGMTPRELRQSLQPRNPQLASR